jgi:hypothetical protein
MRRRFKDCVHFEALSELAPSAAVSDGALYPGARGGAGDRTMDGAAELIQAVARHDRKAFKSLFALYTPE